ncbi:MAG: HAD family hydrolase [Ilumatobacteraceae bacterium]
MTSGARLSRFDGYLFDAGGVLVLPDPTVIAPLLAVFGAATEAHVHLRAHYAGMAAKSRAAAGETDWGDYDRAYVRTVGVPDDEAGEAVELLGRTRSAHLWRWPIADSVTALFELVASGRPVGVVSNASGQVEAVLRRSGVCQVGAGAGADVCCVVDSHVVGVAKPDPAIFDHALVHFEGVERHRIAYVGDSVTMDVGGARAAGLHPVLLDPYDDHPELDADRIRALTDLL